MRDAQKEISKLLAQNEQPLQSVCINLKKVCGHLQEFPLIFNPEEMEEKEEDLVLTGY